MVGIFGMGCAEFDYKMICAILQVIFLLSLRHFLRVPFSPAERMMSFYYHPISFLSLGPYFRPLSYVASIISLKCPCLGEDKFYTSFIHIKEDNDCAFRDRHVIINDFWAKTQATKNN